VKFQYPPGFWLALAAAGVLLAHLVRRRARRLEVPFLPLWATVKGQMRGGFGAAVTRWLDLVFVLVACAAVALAAGAPFRPGTPSTVRDLVLVVDGGVTARAGARIARLGKVAAAEVHRRAPGTRYVLITVRDGAPAVWSGGNRADALLFLAQHEAGWTDAPAGPALALGARAAERLHDADLVLCTHRVVDLPEDSTWRRRVVRVAVENVGIEALEISADPEGGGVLARVQVHGRGELEIDGRWTGTVDGTGQVTLPVRDTGLVTLRVRRRGPPGAGDGFPADDAVFLTLPERAAPRVLVVADREPSAFLVAALEALVATGAVRAPLGRVAPARVSAALEGVDVLIFDRCAPAARSAKPALYIAPPAGRDEALPFRVGPERDAPALFELRREHRLLRGVDLTRVRPGRARAIRGGTPLARAAPGAVLATGADWTAIGFDPELGVLASSPAFPLLLRNALARDTVAPAPEFFRIGAPAPDWGERVVAECGSWRARVTGVVLGPPGFWTLDAGRPAVRPVVAVNLLVPGLDLSPPRRGSDPLAAVGEPAVPDEPLVPHFAAAAIAALLLAWYVFWRP